MRTRQPGTRTTRAKRLRLDEDQVLYFRARRGGLAGGGAPSVVAAARAILGAQAQQPGPGMLALSQRCRDRPSAAAVQAMLLGAKRPLVRTWGQRETLHIYDAHDWHLIAAARPQWAGAGRRGPMPEPALLDRALAIIEAGEAATRDDLLELAPESYLEALMAFQPKYIPDVASAKRFAAGRLFWCLAMRGDVCIGDKIGSKQAYAARTSWFGELPWSLPSPADAAAELTRRYLGLNGPATVKDVAHHFGARAREAAGWVDTLRTGGELVDVECGPRSGLVLLATDAEEAAKPPPKRESDWPLRLLPQWDTYLMSHADKTWTCPDSAEHKLLWRSQAVVAAAIVVRGRIVGEWLREPSSRELDVRVIALSGWNAKFLAGVKREAAGVASHWDLPRARVTVV